MFSSTFGPSHSVPEFRSLDTLRPLTHCDFPNIFSSRKCNLHRPHVPLQTYRLERGGWSCGRAEAVLASSRWPAVRPVLPSSARAAISGVDLSCGGRPRPCTPRTLVGSVSEVDATSDDLYEVVKDQSLLLEARGEKIHPDALPDGYRSVFWTTVLTAAPSDPAHILANTTIQSAD